MYGSHGPGLYALAHSHAIKVNPWQSAGYYLRRFRLSVSTSAPKVFAFFVVLSRLTSTFACIVEHFLQELVLLLGKRDDFHGSTRVAPKRLLVLDQTFQFDENIFPSGNRHGLTFIAGSNGTSCRPRTCGTASAAEMTCGCPSTRRAR